VSEPMRIIILTEYHPHSERGELTGGVEARSFFLSQLLARRHDVTVIASWREGFQRDHMAGPVRVIRPGPHHPYTNTGAIRSRLGYARAAYKAAVALGKADVVDAYCFIAYLPGYWAARRVGAKAVATYHQVWVGSWIRNKGLITGTLGSLWEHAALRKKWDAFIAVSQATARYLVRAGIDPSKVHVVYNGADLETLAGVPAGPPVPGSICIISRLVRYKRLDTFINSLSILRRRRPELYQRTSCNIIGMGSDEAYLKGLAARSDVAEKLVFRGHVERYQTVIRTIKESSLVVHPSSLEGFGIVLVEACACGRPFLASDIEVFREISQALRGGRLFPVGDAHALADELAAFLGGNEIPVGSAETFDWSRLAEKVEEVYRK